MKPKTFHKGGIHPNDYKLSAETKTINAPLPKVAIFPLAQHIGAPAKPVVGKGDKVKVGNLIAEPSGFVSAAIHSSVSGTVAKIDNIIDATGYRKPCIIINVEGDDWEETIDRSDTIETLDRHPEITSEIIVERVKNAGITGMGGAAFPTHVKLSPPPNAKAEFVIINAVECEPYITSDYRLMMEHCEEIIVGTELIMKATKVDQAFIGIEDNKPKAISLFEKKLMARTDIKVVALQKKYPQGGEKQLVDAVINRQVPAPPAIPVNVGAIVQNVGTTFAVYQAVMKNMPLITRYTTITGKYLKEPKNFFVRTGTPINILINECGGLPDGNNKLLAGGPMMGRALFSDEVPITKATNCITILTNDEAKRKEEKSCIRCGSCVEVCPMGLEPYLLARVSEMRMWDKAELEDITSCIECGSCHYTCPANRYLLDYIRKGKTTVMGIIRNRASKK